MPGFIVITAPIFGTLKVDSADVFVFCIIAMEQIVSGHRYKANM